MSTLIDLLVLKVGTRISKILIEAWLGKDSSTVVGDMLEVLFGRFQSTADQRKAEREFEVLGEKISEALLPLFEHASRVGHVNAEAVILELETTLAPGKGSSLLVDKNLDSAAILSELRKLHPLPGNRYSEAEEQLYERALEQAVRRLVEIASKLPQFQEAFSAKSLQELRRLVENTDELLSAVRRIETTITSIDSTIIYKKYEIDYRLAVQRNLDFLEIFGIDLRPESRNQKLSMGYIPLTLQSQSKGEGPLLAGTLLDILDIRGQHLLIRGDAGSGKSTLLRWIAIEAAGGIMKRPVFSSDDAALHDRIYSSTTRTYKWREMVPFLIPLRHCQPGQLPSPEGFPAFVAWALGKPPADWIKNILESGRALVLLDGIDEIPSFHRERLRRNVIELVGQYPQSLFVISTRPKAVKADWLSDSHFQEAQIYPMTDLDRGHFIDRWHAAVSRELSLLARQNEDLPRLAAILKDQLATNPPVARLATNPLLCAMICALHYERRQYLPERQHQLCEALCEALVHRRERESGLNLSEFPETYRNLDYPQKRAAIQEVAHYMVLNGYSSVQIEEAQDKISQALHSFPDHSASDARIVTDALIERSGILREETPGIIGFIHNAFKELLAGDYFADNNDAGLLASRSLDPDWQPTILFSVASSRRGFATQVISMILDFAPDRNLIRPKQVMALRCRAAALFLDEDLQNA